MRNRWLNLILLLTNQIYFRKKNIIYKEGIGVISDILALFFYEIFLGIISLPLYLGVKPSNVTAYLEEKGGYEKIAYDYSLRRVLTLTGVSIVFLIWMLKLVLILTVLNVHEPLRLYSVSNLESVDILRQDLIVAETQIHTANISETIEKPRLTGVEKIKGGNYEFHGTGQPLALVVLFLSGRQTAVFTNEIDKKGQWKIQYSQDDFQLSEGNHAIAAFSYDQKTNSRSRISDQQYFKVQTSILDKLVNNIDIFINFSIIVIIALGILFTVLTI